MTEQMLSYHLQRLSSYLTKLKQTTDPALYQHYANKVKKHWSQGQQVWQHLGQPFLQFNPFTQLNPHVNVQTQLNPHLDLNVQTQINPHLNTHLQFSPKVNIDPDLNVNIRNRKSKKR